jgi:hypothetical protein
MVPTTGGVGVTGCGLIATLLEATDVQFAGLVVTVKLYVPGSRLLIVVLVVLPVIEPGFIVQFPEGNPLNTTLPVDDIHIGCVIVPIVGAAGVVLTVTDTAKRDVDSQPDTVWLA